MHKHCCVCSDEDCRIDEIRGWRHETEVEDYKTLRVPDLLHEVGYLDFAPWHTLHHNAQLVHDSQVLPISEVQGVNVQTRRGKSLFPPPEGRGEEKREEGGREGLR